MKCARKGTFFGGGWVEDGLGGGVEDGLGGGKEVMVRLAGSRV